jgi:hypothetical protein
MKKSILRTIVISAAVSLLALTGCDTPVGDGIWLDEEANPFIGTWTLAGDGMTAALTREFKADGTVVATVPSSKPNTEPTVSTEFYLVKDDILVHSQNYNGNNISKNPFKFRFTVIDNNNIRLLLDTGGYQYWTRVGDENPDADRKIVLANNFAGNTEKYWRWSMSHGETEGAMFMYDWWIIRADGTLHSYHYMEKNKEYIDRGEFAYYFDSGKNRFVILTSAYTVRAYEVSSIDWEANTPHFALLENGATGNPRKFEQFDGETFWESGHTIWTE